MKAIKFLLDDSSIISHSFGNIDFEESIQLTFVNRKTNVSFRHFSPTSQLGLWTAQFLSPVSLDLKIVRDDCVVLFLSLSLLIKQKDPPW